MVAAASLRGSTGEGSLRRPSRGRSVARAFARDALIGLLLLLLFVGGVWGYTGQPFPSRAPLVLVESGSMMNPEAGFGRLNSIEPGDLVFVKNAADRAAVVTADSGLGPEGYGATGDVIVYYPDGDRARTPIIHRAVAWVEVDGSGAEPLYTVREWGLYAVPVVSFAPRNVHDWRPEHEGFVTQGDNPATNPRPDQVTSPPLSAPVRPEWVLGKARGEIPWLGLLKLAVSGTPPGLGHGWCTLFRASAPCDSWTMLGASLLGLVSLPLAYDPLARGLRAVFRRR